MHIIFLTMVGLNFDDCLPHYELLVAHLWVAYIHRECHAAGSISVESLKSLWIDGI